MISVMVVVVDEDHDLAFQVTRQEVVLQQNPDLQGLMPMRDLALCLGMVRCSPDMAHSPLVQSIGEIAGDVRRPVVTTQAEFVDDFGFVTALGFQR